MTSEQIQAYRAELTGDRSKNKYGINPLAVLPILDALEAARHEIDILKGGEQCACNS